MIGHLHRALRTPSTDGRWLEGLQGVQLRAGILGTDCLPATTPPSPPVAARARHTPILWQDPCNLFKMSHSPPLAPLCAHLILQHPLLPHRTPTHTSQQHQVCTGNLLVEITAEIKSTNLLKAQLPLQPQSPQQVTCSLVLTTQLQVH